MSVRGRLLGTILLAAVVSCAVAARPAPSAPSAGAAKPAPAAAPPASAKPPGVDGTLDPAAVAAYVRWRLGKVKACYESALKTDRTLVGKIVVAWTIDADGVPRNVDVEANSMPTSVVADCIEALVEEWRFPKPTGGSVEVSFPFVFQSHE